MASDGFQDIPGSYSQSHTTHGNPSEPVSSSYAPPYPSHYGPDRVPMPQPQVPQSSTPTNHYPEPPPRNPSAWQSQPQQYPGGINEAVHSAFHQNDNPAYLSPDVLNRITENVIQQLKSTTLGTQPPPAQHPPQPPWAQVPQNQYPSEYATPPPGVSQNPSPIPPDIYREKPDYPPAPSSGYSGSPRPYPRPPSVSPAEHRESPVSQASERGQREPRPRPPSREETITEMTTLEKIWRKFFEEGQPTERLGQFLRGIANHLIEDYAPENSLVVVPEKMQKFYEDTQIPGDPYPWQDIFDDRSSYISRLYRDVEAEHHLVQRKLKDRPDMPGLTPRGFQTWATLQIRAHPDREYERLQKAVRHMPISNADDRKERFPKEIPRRLFPDAPDLALREKLDQYIMKHCNLELPSITDEEIREATVRRHKMSTSSSTSTRDSVPAFSERERKSRYQPAVEDDDDEENEIISPQPIERQRKPYTAQPGGGKVYEDSSPAPPMNRHTNTSSTGSIPRNSPVPSNRGTDGYSHHRAGSSGMPRPATGRSLSPPRGAHPMSDYRHSESDLFSSNGGSRYPGTSSAEHYYTTAAPNLTGDLDDSRRYRDLDRELEDQRLYESIRAREKEREWAKYRDRNPKRSSWADGDDYYRGAHSGSPVGGFDYKTYTYK